MCKNKKEILNWLLEKLNEKGNSWVLCEENKEIFNNYSEIIPSEEEQIFNLEEHYLLFEVEEKIFRGFLHLISDWSENKIEIINSHQLLELLRSFFFYSFY